MDLKIHPSWCLSDAKSVEGANYQNVKVIRNSNDGTSLAGYGGHLNNQTVQFFWSDERRPNINNLELQAVLLSVKHFLTY